MITGPEKLKNHLVAKAEDISVDSKSLKAFALTFLIFILFAHWSGGSSDATIFVTQSLAENSSLTIGEFRETGYSSNIDGEYFSENPPLTAAMALPAYYTVKIFFGVPSQDVYTSYFLRSPDSATSYLKLLSVISVSSIAGVLSIWLIFKILNKLKPETRTVNLYISILGGLGSLIFTYSTVLSGIMPSTFFILAAIYLWIRYRDKTDLKKQLLPYLLIGLGISSNYFLFVPAIALITTDMYRARSGKQEVSPTNILLGLFVGLSPLLFYNLFTSGNMFDFTLALNLLQPEGLDLSRLVNPLFSPKLGLLFHSPLAVLGTLGLKKLYRNDRELCLFICLTVVGSLIAVASTTGWTDSTAFGPKHLVPASTLLIIPLGVLASEISKKKRYGLYGIGTIGILIQLLSTQPWNTSSHLINYYLTNFSSQGFQSPLTNFLVSSPSLDMVLGPYPSQEFYLTNSFGMNIVYSQAHLIAGIVLFAVLALFYRDLIKTCAGITDRFEEKHLFILVSLLLLSGLESTDPVHLDGWYPHLDQEDIIWSREDPSLILNSVSGGETVIRYELDPITPRNISFRLNGEEIDTVELDERHQNTEILDLEKGPNTLKLKSNKSCTTIGETTNGNDVRCTHLGLREIGLVRPVGDNIYPAGGFTRRDDSILIEDEARFIISGDSNYSLSLKPRLEGGDKGEIEVFVDDRKIDETKVDEFGSTYNSPYFGAENITDLRIDYNCKDCERLVLEDISLQEYEDQSHDILYRLGRSWYQKVEDEEYQWSYGSSTVNIYNYENKTVEKALWLEGRSYSEPQIISFKLNGQEIGSRLVGNKQQRTVAKDSGVTTESNQQFFNIELEPGENILKMEPKNECFSTADLSDVRCMSYGIKNLYLTETHPDNLEKFKSIYGPENDLLTPREDSLTIFADYNASLALDAVLRSVNGKAKAKIGEKEWIIEEFPARFSTPYIDPENKTVEIEFECMESKDCKIEVVEISYRSFEEHSSDRFFRYGQNWYKELEKEGIKWGREGNNSIYFYSFSDKPENRSIELELTSFHKPREVSFYMNGNLLKKETIVDELQKYRFNTTVTPGENIFKMETNSCASKGEVNNNDDIRCASIGNTEVLYHATDPQTH